MKWDNAERRSIFDKLVSLTAEAPAEGKPKPDVIIWPETAVPYILTSTPEALSRIGEVLQDGQVLLTGAVREEKHPVAASRAIIIPFTRSMTGASLSMPPTRCISSPSANICLMRIFFAGLGFRKWWKCPAGLPPAPRAGR